MNWLWRYLLGYLTIELDAEKGEQILNKALCERINIWNLRCKKGKITGDISVKSFYKLRYIKRGIKCTVKILNKYGLPFKTNKYNKRVGFAIGAVFYAAILIFLSNFIWIINVEGNNKISTQKILNSCEKIGITEGVYKGRIKNKYDAQRLQLITDGIAWCSLNIEGSVLTVSLSETVIADKQERIVPSNIKSSFDGKIKKINISSGVSTVKVGDFVSRGQLLVSGINKNQSSTVFVHADGEIIADTVRVFSSEAKFVQIIKAPTNKIIKRNTFEIFGVKIPFYFGNIKRDYNYNVKVHNYKFFNKKIPIKKATECYEILQEKTIMYDEKTLEKMLYDDIQKQIKNYNFINVTERNRETIKTDVGILMKIEYICEENIAVQDAILLNTEN